MTGLSNRRSVMTLYADAGDPLGHSVRLVLREKDINSNVVLVPDGTRPEILNDFKNTVPPKKGLHLRTACNGILVGRGL